MKPVQDRCSELSAGLQKLRSSKDDEARARELESRRAELEKVSTSLLLAAASAHVLLEHGKIVEASLPDCAKALESCDKVEALLDPDPSAITKGRSYKDLLTRAQKAVEQLHKVNEEAWRVVVSQHQSVDEAFLRRVESFPRQAQTVARLRELKGQYDESTKRVPVGAEAYQRFEVCYAALQRELKTLDPDAFPDDVLSFFHAAQQATGAPLSLFTNSVRDWLEKNDFLDGVRVRFTGAE